MPNSPLEIAQAGIPIVASAVGGIPEFIVDQKTGLLITDLHNPAKYTEAIQTVCTDSEMAESLALGAFDKLRTGFSTGQYEASVEHMLKHVGV